MKKLLSNFGKLSLFALIVITLTLLTLTLTSCSLNDKDDMWSYKIKANQIAKNPVTFFALQQPTITVEAQLISTINSLP